VVSTWFCSIEDPFNVAMRKAGQRWVKITYFRDLDLLQTRRPLPDRAGRRDYRATERRFPRGKDFDLRFSDARGTDLTIGYTRAMRERCSRAIAGAARWRPTSPAASPLPADPWPEFLGQHGDARRAEAGAHRRHPLSQWAIASRAVRRTDRGGVREQQGDRGAGKLDDAVVLREMTLGSRLIEGGGCGFNPKAPRHTIYPAGSNAPGALHFGVDLAQRAISSAASCPTGRSRRYTRFRLFDTR